MKKREMEHEQFSWVEGLTLKSIAGREGKREGERL
jgi:hypothetical protein